MKDLFRVRFSFQVQLNNYTAYLFFHIYAYIYLLLKKELL
jgi:hypothetical protein